MTDMLSNMYGQVHYLLKQYATDRVQCYWQIGACLQAWNLLEERTLLVALTKLLEVRLERRFSLAQWRQTCRVYAAFPQGVDRRLSWTHYCLLSSIADVKTRQFYAKQAIQSAWTTKQLRRLIRSRYYERSRAENGVLKQQYCFDFLQPFPEKYSEGALEAALQSQLADFLLELGQGFSWVARQQKLRSHSGRSLFVDWVFYHYLQQRFILVELKVQGLRHAHIGQLDTYVRLFETHWRQPNRQATLGLLLCPQLDEGLLLHSALATNPQLWAATYTVNTVEGKRQNC